MRKLITAALVSLFAAAGLVIPATATADSVAEYLCNVNQNTWVYQNPGASNVLYTIPAGGGFRFHLEGVQAVNGRVYAWGHGNEVTYHYRWGAIYIGDGRLYNCQQVYP